MPGRVTGGFRARGWLPCVAPERVDDGPATSPSKRLEKADPNYMKTVTGPLLIAQAGLGAVLERCPVFAEWWEDLLA